MEFYSLILFSFIIFSVPGLRKIYFGQRFKQENETIKKRIVFFDFLKGLAILAVILIHVAYFFETSPFADNNDLFINLMNNLARFAIPVFVISSGVLLSPPKNKKETIDFYLRKIWRIFLPYLLCTIIYALAVQSNFVTFIYNLISGNAAVPYYFVIVLLELYLLYPFLYKFKESRYFLPLAFVFSFLGCFTPVFFEFYGIPLFFQMIFFFAYGICLRDKFLGEKPDKKELPFWLSIIVFYIILIVIRPEWYYNVRLFYGLAIFNLLFYFKKSIDPQNLLYRIVAACGQNSLWIYLIHFAIVNLIYDYFKSLSLNYYVNFFLIYAASLVVILIVAKLIQLIYDYATTGILKLKNKV